MPNLNVKQYTIILLCFLAAVSGYRYGYENILGQMAVAVLLTGITNSIIEYFRTKTLRISDSGLITGLIISMVLAPNSSLLLTGLLSIVAIASKYILRLNNRPVFNPAAFGLMIGLIFFNNPLGWWGDYYHILTIIAGSILLIKFAGHWKIIFAFLTALSILILVRALISGPSIIDQLYLNISISSFFTFFMLTDPKTSPLLSNQFISFGILTAMGSFLALIFFPSALFVGGLLVADAFVPYLNYRSLRTLKQPALKK
jgi:Na+-translocating ferredoxin:NAD+ oxidoreductase RnfD subunit